MRALAKRLDEWENKTEALAMQRDNFSRNTRIQFTHVFDAPRPHAGLDAAHRATAADAVAR